MNLYWKKRKPREELELIEIKHQINKSFSPQGSMVGCLTAMLKLMNEKHYNKILDGFGDRNSLQVRVQIDRSICQVTLPTCKITLNCNELLFCYKIFATNIPFINAINLT